MSCATAAPRLDRAGSAYVAPDGGRMPHQLPEGPDSGELGVHADGGGECVAHR